MIGCRFGGAVVVRLIGTGGMGAVYEAENRLLGKRYAVKVVLPELAGSPTAVERFFQEARAAAAVEHPRIVSVIDCGYTDDGRPFQIMPFLTGHDLDSHCLEVGAHSGHPGRLDLARAAPLFFQVLDGLAAAHDRQIVHRDLKGANIQVLEDNTIKILDFGIAKLFDPSLRGVRTGTFQVVGTPGYMSPEQARAGPIDYRTDIWALGAVFFKVLTGRLPFEGSDLIEVAAKVVATAPPSPTELVPEIPTSVSEVLLACLAVDPNVRPDSARVLARALMAAMPGGRSIAERVAPELALRSGPSDPTVTLSSPRSGDAAWSSRVSSTLQLSVKRRIPWHLAFIAVLAGAGIGVAAAVEKMLAGRDTATPSPAGADALDIEPQSAGRVVAPVVPPGPRPAAVKPVEKRSLSEIPDARPLAITAGAAAAGFDTAPEPVKETRPERMRTRKPTPSGTLIITVNPWADVWIDGKRATTPVKEELLVGRHTVKLKRANGLGETVRVRIREGRTTRIERDWSMP